MKIAILGYDVEGRSSYEYFAADGHEISIRDKNTDIQIPAGVDSVLGENYLDNLADFDLLVRTPGLHPRMILAKYPDIANKITTQTNEFFKVSPTKNVIGVTGTKGKGTTSTLLAKLLEASGKQVKLGGNIGVPALSFVSELSENSWVVLELSNFQLIDCTCSPHIAICLGVVAEHLDWHTDMEEYLSAKANIFAHQSNSDIAIYYPDNQHSSTLVEKSIGRHIPYTVSPGAIVKNDAIIIEGHEICKTSDLQLLGKHNWQNVCAAITAIWQVTQDVDVLLSVLRDFQGLEHRIEFVRVLDGVRFYNDSYASGLKATEAAIEAVPGKKVMILGGYERMLDIDFFGKFAVEHANEFRSLLLIGASSKRLAAMLDKAGFTNYVLAPDLKTMEAIVSKARELAEFGDSIVLSPGFASFDMFKNFSDRGRQFKEVVQGI